MDYYQSILVPASDAPRQNAPLSSSPFSYVIPFLVARARYRIIASVRRENEWLTSMQVRSSKFKAICAGETETVWGRSGSA